MLAHELIAQQSNCVRLRFGAYQGAFSEIREVLGRVWFCEHNVWTDCLRERRWRAGGYGKLDRIRSMDPSVSLYVQVGDEPPSR